MEVTSMTNIAQRLTALFATLFLFLSLGALPAQAQEQYRVIVEFTKCEANLPAPCGGGIVQLEQGAIAEPRVPNEAEPRNTPDNAGGFREERFLPAPSPEEAIRGEASSVRENVYIGLGILTFVFLLALILWLFWRRRPAQPTRADASQQGLQRCQEERERLAASLTAKESDLATRTQELEAARAEINRLTPGSNRHVHIERDFDVVLVSVEQNPTGKLVRKYKTQSGEIVSEEELEARFFASPSPAVKP